MKQGDHRLREPGTERDHSIRVKVRRAARASVAREIHGRNQISEFKDWVRLDLEYIDNWSLWLDLKILARTIPVVFTGAGAK